MTERQVGWEGSATIKREACLTIEKPHTAKISNVAKPLLMSTSRDKLRWGQLAT